MLHGADFTPANNGRPFRAVVFDCDGTLVDSERLYAEVDAELFAQHGAPISAEDILATYTGQTVKAMLADVQSRFGVRFPDDLPARMEALVDDRLARDLRAFAGAVELTQHLAASDVPLAVASNSFLSRVRSNLAATGLAALFGDRLATGDRVKQPKPAPDVYLLAAQMVGIAPADCVAVEDSPTGVRGAVAAGMTVIGFADGHHGFAPAALLDAGAALVVPSYAVLADVLLPDGQHGVRLMQIAGLA
jgi:HAD superfamily hydrolase (TIGR01509 family)